MSLFRQDLTRGPVMSGMLLFALPLIAGNLLQQAYNIADTLIVGRVLGVSALGAVGSAFSLMTFVTSVILGLCMGSGALLSILYGRGDKEALRRSTFAAFVLIAAVTAVVTAVCFCLTDSLRILLQVPDDAWDPMRSYIVVVFWGIPAVFLYNFYASVLRAIGNSVTPLIFLAVCAALNIALDLLFIAGMRLGTWSAAAATVASQWVSGVGLMLHSERKAPRSVSVWHSAVPVHRNDLHAIASFSFLTCLQQSVMNLGILMVQGLVNSFGIVTMAAFSAAVKIDAFAYMPVQDFGNAFSTFTAQNYGAENPDRIRKGIAAAVTVSVVFSTAVSAAVCAFAPELMSAFIAEQNSDAIRCGTEYLRIEGPFYFAIGILFLLYGLYRAVGRPGFSVVLTVFSLGTRVVLAYMLSATAMGEAGIWWSVPIGWILADTVGAVYFIVRKGRLLSPRTTRLPQ